MDSIFFCVCVTEHALWFRKARPFLQLITLRFCAVCHNRSASVIHLILVLRTSQCLSYPLHRIVKMDLINETTPLINPTIHHSQQDNVDVQYPSIPVSELILKVNEILNSTTDHHHSGVSDLVSMGGDAAFYAVVKTLLDVPHDKRDILQLWAINILDILLERDAYHTRIRSILLHDWEDQGSGTQKP
jgi:hypothetical protein